MGAYWCKRKMKQLILKQAALRRENQALYEALTEAEIMTRPVYLTIPEPSEPEPEVLREFKPMCDDIKGMPVSWSEEGRE